LIPFNPFPGKNYRCSPRATVLQFQKQLMNAGLVATIRKTRGDDIVAACGQLAGEVQDKTKRTLRLKQQEAAAS
jgi:23S rRNA (adenine2503-C2)-methyltransferase